MAIGALLKLAGHVAVELLSHTLQAMVSTKAAESYYSKRAQSPLYLRKPRFVSWLFLFTFYLGDKLYSVLDPFAIFIDLIFIFIFLPSASPAQSVRSTVSEHASRAKLGQ